MAEVLATYRGAVSTLAGRASSLRSLSSRCSSPPSRGPDKSTRCPLDLEGRSGVCMRHWHLQGIVLFDVALRAKRCTMSWKIERSINLAVSVGATPTIYRSTSTRLSHTPQGQSVSWHVRLPWSTALPQSATWRHPGRMQIHAMQNAVQQQTALQHARPNWGRARSKTRHIKSLALD